MTTPSRSPFTDDLLKTIIEEVVGAARANVPDCRLGYVEVQLDRDSIDFLTDYIGQARIEWHPEPCTHEDSKWVKS